MRRHTALLATIAVFVIGMAVVVAVVWSVGMAQPKPATVVPAADTTYITRPVAEDGCIDYETALNERMAKGVKPENNANVILFQALGPRPEGADMPPGYFQWL